MAISDEYLPQETGEARRTQGSSEVARLVDHEVLPREIFLGTSGRSVDPGEAGWWVELRGAPPTLATLARLFGAGDFTIVARGGQHFLRANEFEEIADEHEVRIRAAAMVREAVGAAEVAGEAVTPVEVAAVRRIP